MTSKITDDHQPSLPGTLQEAQIPTLPPSAYYIPNFITPAEESALLDKVMCPVLYFPSTFPSALTHHLADSTHSTDQHRPPPPLENSFPPSPTSLSFAAHSLLQHTPLRSFTRLALQPSHPATTLPLALLNLVLARFPYRTYLRRRPASGAESRPRERILARARDSAARGRRRILSGCGDCVARGGHRAGRVHQGVGDETGPGVADLAGGEEFAGDGGGDVYGSFTWDPRG